MADLSELCSRLVDTSLEPSSEAKCAGSIPAAQHPPPTFDEGGFIDRRVRGKGIFLVIQFPFADARSFLDDRGGRLARPAWPLAEPGRDFIRSSGVVRPRRRGGLKEWAGEELFGDGSRALRFPDHLGHALYGTEPGRGTLTCLFRRFHSDGTVARFEVGLRFEPQPGATPAPVNLYGLITQILGMKVSVCGSGTVRQLTALAGAGRSLAGHYLAATTDHRVKPRQALQNWWMTSGTPALIIEYDSDVILPPHSRFVQEVPDAGATLSHTWFEVGQRCCVWLVRHDHGDPEAARKLRMHLVRLHAERECLRCVIQHAENRKFDLSERSLESDAVQEYLRNALRLVQKPRRMGLDQGPMLQAAREALGTALPGETASLKISRRQIEKRVRGYVDAGRRTATVINIVNQYRDNSMSTNIQMGNVTVSGDFNQVTAATIQGSFNKVASSDAGAELREKLNALAVQVANLARQLPPADAEHVSKDLESLTSEALSKAPRQKWYELSADGLLEAAKTVAGMAEPVTQAVKAVLALIAS